MRSISFVLGFVLSCAGLAQAPCAAHLGGSWYINCGSLVSYQGQDVVSFSNWADPVGSVNLDVYGTKGKLEAQVRNGKLSMGDPKRYVVQHTGTLFSLTDASTDRIICILKDVPPTTKDASCQVDVWLDLFVSGTGYFHCDPESSNDPVMEMMKSSTFRNMGFAVSLN